MPWKAARPLSHTFRLCARPDAAQGDGWLELRSGTGAQEAPAQIPMVLTLRPVVHTSLPVTMEMGRMLQATLGLAWGESAIHPSVVSFW